MASNRLSESKSLYLLQHAGNPVHWQMWSKDLLRDNAPEHKLMIISIGYSSCHWCHVMEEESFEDPEVAQLMNTHYRAVKVDREERPDIDARYMNALQLMTGTGGWPLNIIALPDGTPVYGGTYFSRKDWMAALTQVADLWQKEPEQVLSYGVQMREGLQQMIQVTLKTKPNSFSAQDFEDVVGFWMRTVDPVNGGPNGAPKFPLPSNYGFLLDYACHTSDSNVLDYCLLSLEKMALGGIFDWVHGGITRYSTDRFWKVPHFEKMLYDNGQIMGVFAKAFRASAKGTFLTAAEAVANFLEAEMKLSNGLFASALDADSATPEAAREEGGYYTWTSAELDSLELEQRAQFNDYFDITPYSAWEGKYILHRTNSLDFHCKEWGISNAEGLRLENVWHQALKNASKERIKTHSKPVRDNKALCTWNALVVLGFFELHLAAPHKGYMEKAIELLSAMRAQLLEEGAVLHEFGGDQGFLDDHATFGLALLKGYAFTGNEEYVLDAKNIAAMIGEKFSKEASSFYLYAAGGDNAWEEVIEIEDNVIPSANSYTAQFFYELGCYTGDHTWIDRSTQMMESIHGKVFKHGQNFSNWLNLALMQSYGSKELVVVGPEARAILGSMTENNYRPNTLYLQSEHQGSLPLTLHRGSDASKIYVCENGACNLPTSSTEEAERLWKA
ncbi:MAG: thioredoxin domain-containing protein [Cryomorphaceae bacterium]